MSPNSSIIISDTSSLILLIKINELDLLRNFARRVIITSVIKEELNIKLPDWIEVIDPKDKHYQNILELDLDKGEASAIALMLEIDNCVLLIDDLKARKMAQKLNLKFSGSFGLFLKSKELGLIQNIRPIIDKIRLTNFRFSEDLLADIL